MSNKVDFEKGIWYHIGMKVYAISDFHLSNGTNKPMDVFGEKWVGHWDKISEVWKKEITDEDIVLSAGDTSWAMNLSEAKADLAAIDALPGKKFIIRGNHDYWWTSYKKINDCGYGSIRFIQNNAFCEGDYVICGTRGWTVADGEASEEDKKIFSRELIRLEMTLLEAAKKQEGKKILLLMHYPPFNSRFEDSAFTDVIEKYDVDKVIYGHLHGNRSRYVSQVTKKGTDYLLTSCDFLDFSPLRIY